MAKKLEVKNLIISFRTNNGTVKAVRDISFDLEKGETLAIVGESGSGKSVTARAIMGILAKNAIPEGGEIIYDGQDLMKIDEEDFHKIRGNRISMIFQDPLSSLNPRAWRTWTPSSPPSIRLPSSAANWRANTTTPMSASSP